MGVVSDVMQEDDTKKLKQVHKFIPFGHAIFYLNRSESVWQMKIRLIY